MPRDAAAGTGDDWMFAALNSIEPPSRPRRDRPIPPSADWAKLRRPASCSGRRRGYRSLPPLGDRD